MQINQISDAFKSAVKEGSPFTTLVDGRRGYPASGVVYEQNLLLASNHAVQIEDGIALRFEDGTSTEGAVVGRDPFNDLVLIKHESGGQTPSLREDRPETGELSLALARPTKEGIQATFGIISISRGAYDYGHGSSIRDVIRSDAVSFPGFAGGPLIDTEGKLIGVNVLGHQFGSFLTIPASTAWERAEKMKNEGSIKVGYLGVKSQPAETADGEIALLVISVENDSPADKAKILTGDILVSIDDTKIQDHQTLMAVLTGKQNGDAVTVELIRGGERKTVSVTLSAREPWSSQRRGRGGHHGRHHRHRR